MSLPPSPGGHSHERQNRDELIGDFRHCKRLRTGIRPVTPIQKEGVMKIILVAAAAVLGLAAGSARAEGPNTFEMVRTAKPIMAGQSGTDIASESMPVFSGSARHSSTLV